MIGSLLRFNVIRNPGAAFSLGTGFTLIFIALGLTATAFGRVLNIPQPTSF